MKKCPNCGYERRPDDDRFGIISASECPKCRVIYSKIETAAAMSGDSFSDTAENIKLNSISDRLPPNKIKTTEESSITITDIRDEGGNEDTEGCGKIDIVADNYLYAAGIGRTEKRTGYKFLVWILFLLLIFIVTAYFVINKTERKTKSLPRIPSAVSVHGVAEDYFDKAKSLCFSGECTDPQRAIEYLSEAIRLKPDYAEAYQNRGFVYSQMKQYPSAIKDYDQAIRLKPDFMETYYNRGNSYLKLQQYQSAIKDYDEAIKLKPDVAMSYNNRGNAYRNLQQYQSAVKDYDQAILLRPDNLEAYSNRGFIHLSLQQYQAAIRYYDEVIRLKPDSMEAYNNRGNAYLYLNQYQPAIKDYDEAIRLKPDNTEAYNNRGVAYIFSGNTGEGCLSIKRACELGNCKGNEWGKKEGYCQ